MIMETVYCTICGEGNVLDAAYCQGCGAEIILPHPIQLDGGEIYTLPCDDCGARIAVGKARGGVVCESCGLYHQIVRGEGYLTLRPLPGMVPPEEEEEEPPVENQGMEEAKPEAQVAASPEIGAADRRQQVEARIARLEGELKQRKKKYNLGHSRRIAGMIYVPLSILAGVIWAVAFTNNERSAMETLNILCGITVPAFFIIGLVGLASAPSASVQKEMKTEIDQMEFELFQLKNELVGLQTGWRL